VVVAERYCAIFDAVDETVRGVALIGVVGEERQAIYRVASGRDPKPL
jgi:hypothetical protein